MIARNINSGVLQAPVKNIFGRKNDDRPVSTSALLQACQPVSDNQVNQNEVSNLISKFETLEMAVGKLIVARERYWHKVRLKTIAKRQVENMRNMRRDQWLGEARSLVRYFGTLKENDAATAQEILRAYLPVDQVTAMAEPNIHGRTRGAYEADKHLIQRGNPLFTGEQHG